MLVMTLRPRHRAHPLSEPALAEEPTVHLAMEPDKRIPHGCVGGVLRSQEETYPARPGPQVLPRSVLSPAGPCSQRSNLSHPLSNNLVVQRKRVGGVTEGPYED